ncbi:MFS transporter [Pelomonas aquatica]|jgi:predicted MFS family arabinose efflux permease|uniref:MFS transporter n=1 Tax=Pelomonas aquatica TaxID=431058 RepID=A0A9X4LE15_9BURK|nr:MFS transporter [Pelomonas aquatica]MCY4753302.1 MFS transporter [Pelomonas aquatica]MDG0861379.1 MFS transporter [Pelomonas aquatica]
MKSTPAPHAAPAVLGPALTFLLATATGLAVASIYYVQPLLGLLAQQFGVGSATIGLLPTLTQLGYGAAILLLSPLGDRYDRRRIIAVKSAALVAALAFAALAPSFGALGLASVAIGLTATLAQDLVPAAATLAPEAERGRRVGQVMMGLLLGILLSRVAAGSLAALAGWRAVYASAAVAVALLIPLLWRSLPRFVPATSAGYGALLASMAGLWMKHAPLRRAALAQGLLSVAFSAFWSTLALVLAGPEFGQGSAVAGAFGLAGAAGALAAPLAGGLADRRGPQAVIRVGALLVLAAFAVQALAPASLWLMVVVAVVFDLGVQAALVSHQSVVYGLDPASRSRLNAVLVSSMFAGMASGAALGSVLLASLGWRAVPALGAIAALGALAVARPRP